MERRVAVRCYAGYKGEERPTSFTVDGLSHGIAEIADRWYDPDYDCFNVVAEDGRSYLLRHDLNTGFWSLLEKDQNG